MEDNMLVIRNIITGGCSLLVLIGMMVFSFGPRYGIVPSAILALAAAITASWFVLDGELSRFDRVMLGSPNVVQLASMLLLLLFVESSWIRLSLVILTSLLQAGYLTHVFFFLHVPSRYVPETLQTITSFLHTLTMFSLGTAMFGFGLLTEVPFIALLTSFAMLSSAVLFHAFWVMKIDMRRAKRLTAFGVLMLVELVVACSFLPTSLYVNGVLVALGAYVTLFLFRVSPSDPHFAKTAKRAMWLASSLFALVLISAPWR